MMYINGEDGNEDDENSLKILAASPLVKEVIG